MQKLQLEGDQVKAPQISFDNTNGEFEIKGISCMENAKSFYTPVMNWLEEYVKMPNRLTELNIHLKYFNTSSAKYLLEIMETLNHVLEKAGKLEINWYYQEGDDDMNDAITTYSELINFNINKIKVKS